MHRPAFTTPWAPAGPRHAHSPHAPRAPTRRALPYAAPVRRARQPPRADLRETDTVPRSADRMGKTLESVRSTFNTIRTGRASPSILDRVIVSYYGADTPLNQLASVSLSGTASLLVEPYDKGCVRDVERAIMESDVGIMPSSDGVAIRLAVPPLTEERRKQLVKQVKALAEDGRVAIRNIRRDAVDELKKLEKAKELGKDESMSLQDDVQKLTDKHVKQIDNMLKEKEADIMKV